MTDVDGTLTDEDGSLNAAAGEAVRRLEGQGITVGLVSGRELPSLDALAQHLGISGPIIAENGGVARMKPGSEPLDLGYSRQPALEVLERLKKLFPGAIREREDNAERLVDVVFFADGVTHKELKQYLGDIQYYDSGYVLHLMQPGISKGTTLIRLLADLGDVSAATTIVFGDSPTDISLFKLFPYSVLIPNPRLPAEHRQEMQRVARYVSDLPCGQGFAQVAFHIADACSG